jgi:hypothetical protein
MSSFLSHEYRLEWKKQKVLELWSGIAMIWSKLTSSMLCYSAVRRRLRCILWLGTMWQYWAAWILPMLSTGRWLILTLLIQGTTILRNVSCSYAAGLLALPDLLTCLWSSVVRIIVTNLSKSVKCMCSLVPLLLLSVYSTGSLSYYMLHGAGGRTLIVLLIHSCVTVRISFG